MRTWRHIAAALAVAASAAVGGLVWLTAAAEGAGDPNALWHIVHDLCATDMKANGLPAPCTAVDLAKGYAVLKDIRGATQLLIVPTDRLTGIEDPKLLAPAAPNYWQDAWDARALFEKRAGKPVGRDDVGLAINSVDGRSQNQLHIHLDCVRPDVAASLKAVQRRIGRRWAALPIELAGRRYRAMWIEGADLGARNPFALLAAEPSARADMGRETLILVPVTSSGGRPGFVLLSDRADLAANDNGHGEDLLDHQCAVLDRPGG
ncbi:MAG TPA: CDP-diacylglycerol diphosphatase [Caulobacteraceae bacterium]|nr:CDP-diacylglycerol diphosphatase [Caulobacteraceae bacterium]